MLKRLFYFLIVVLVFDSCASVSDTRDVTQINISNYRDHQIMCEDIFTQVDSMDLLSLEGCPMGQIKSACKDDSVLYLLDEVNSIFSFDLKTGKIKRRITSVGNAKNEYVSLDVICVKNGKLVALDMNSMAILTFTSDLNFENRYHINFPCLDIVPVNRGYLAFNMNASEEKKSIVLLDDSFKEVKSFGDSDFGVNHLPSSKLFSQTDDGACFISPKDDDVYEWKNDSLKLAYHLNMSDENISGTIHRNTISFFKMNNLLISTFLSGKKVYFNFYRKDKSMAGSVKLSNGQTFMPVFQDRNVLYSIQPAKYNQKVKTENGYRKEAVLVKCN